MCAGPEYPVNKTGGALTHEVKVEVKGHKLSEQEMPKHSHDVGYQIIPWGYQGDAYGAIGRNTQNSLKSGSAGEGKEHTHETKVTMPDEILPPYYALSYIMKIK